VFWKSNVPAGQEYVLLATTNAFSYLTPDLEASKTYFFYVRANVGATYFYSNVVELFVSCGKGVVLSADPPPSPDPQPLNYLGAGYTWGVAVYGGYLYFTDNWNHKVIKMLKSRFTQAKCVARWGTYGSGDGQLNSPDGVATDGLYLYVKDSGRIQKFSMNFEFVASTAAQGTGLTYTPNSGGRLYTGYHTDGLKIRRTSDLAVTASGFLKYWNNYAVEDQDGGVYAASAPGGYDDVSKVSLSGSSWIIVQSVAGWGDRCDGLTADANHIYFSDYYSNRVGRFDRGTMANLTFTAGWFDRPYGLAVDDTHVYVGTYDGRVGRFLKSTMASPEFTYGTWQPAIGSYKLVW
jgi:hypothetical protein